MKKILIIAGIVIIALGSAAFLKDLIIKSVVTTVASGVTGAPVHIDAFSLSILSSTINISGFRMYNPPGFPEGILVSCPKIKVVYDRASLFSQKRRFPLVEVELKEMGLTKIKGGKLNVDALKIVQQPKGSAPTPLQIDMLTLSIGKIVYKDYTAGPEPVVRVFDVNSRKSYKGVPTAQQLALLVLAAPMKAAAIKDAGIYGVALVAGVAILPVGVAATLIGKDSVRQTVNVSFSHAYKISLEVAGRMGRVTGSDERAGMVKVSLNGAAVTINVSRKTDRETEITVSARKYMFPKLDIAGGVLYQIMDKLR